MRPAGCKHKGWVNDALKGLVSIVTVAGGAAAEAVSVAVSATMVEAHAFLTDEERMENAKKTVLDAKDMVVMATQAACTMVQLAKLVPSVTLPAAIVCKACEAAALLKGVPTAIGQHSEDEL